MLTISQVESVVEIRAARELIREFTAWAFSIQEGSEEAPTFANLEEELANVPGKYSPPAGCFLLAAVDNQPAGCIALIPHDESTCEVKRLYVRPAFRGHRIGWQLVTEVIERARQSGYTRIVLDSHVSMTDAHRIYSEVGFQNVEAPQDFPEEFKHYVVFMVYDIADNR